MSAASLGLSIVNGKIGIDPSIQLSIGDYDPAELTRIFTKLFGLMEQEGCIALLNDRSRLNLLLEARLASLIPDYSVSFLAQRYSFKGSSIKDPFMLQPISEEWLDDPVLLETFVKPATLSCGHSFSSHTIQQLQPCVCPTCRSSSSEPRENLILQAFAEDHILLSVTLEEKIASIEQEIRQIAALTQDYEKSLLELENLFVSVVELAFEQASYLSVSELQEKEALVRQKQAILLDLEYRLPYLRFLHQHWTAQLEAAKDQAASNASSSAEASDDKCEEMQKKELARLGFLRHVVLERAHLVQKSLQAEEQYESLDEKKIIKRVKRAIYEEVPRREAFLQGEKNKDEAILAHVNLLKKLRDCERAVEQASRCLKTLERDPLRHSISDLDQTSNETGKKALQAYIDEELTPNIRSKKQRVQELKGRTIALYQNADLTERINFCGVRTIREIGRSYNTCYYSAAKIFPVEAQEKIFSFIEQSKIATSNFTSFFFKNLPLK